MLPDCCTADLLAAMNGVLAREKAALAVHQEEMAHAKASVDELRSRLLKDRGNQKLDFQYQVANDRLLAMFEPGMTILRNVVELQQDIDRLTARLAAEAPSPV